MKPIGFTVYGTPQPRGSKRAFPFKKGDGKLGVAVSDANPKSQPWMDCIREAALRASCDGGLLRGPLAVQFRFVFPRPKGHFRTGKNSMMLKASAPLSPAKKPDLLKLARGAEDALTGVIYLDDAQIVYEELSKCYGEPARLEVIIQQRVEGPSC